MIYLLKSKRLKKLVKVGTGRQKGFLRDKKKSGNIFSTIFPFSFPSTHHLSLFFLHLVFLAFLFFPFVLTSFVFHSSTVFHLFSSFLFRAISILRVIKRNLRTTKATYPVPASARKRPSAYPTSTISARLSASSVSSDLEP